MFSLLRLILVLGILVLAFWFVKTSKPGLFARAGQDARQGVGEATREVRKGWDRLDKQAIVEELRRTGRVVRRKTEQAVRKVAEDTEDARTTAAIKTRLAVEPGLSALDISVDTTEGVVTLAGRVDSPADVARAMEIALEQDGVHEVISTLQVVRPAPAS